MCVRLGSVWFGGVGVGWSMQGLVGWLIGLGWVGLGWVEWVVRGLLSVVAAAGRKAYAWRRHGVRLEDQSSREVNNVQTPGCKQLDLAMP